MAKRYRVTLTQQEREELQQMIRKGKSAATKLAHARVLLLQTSRTKRRHARISRSPKR